MGAKKILIICTSQATYPTGEPTGLWLEELAAPYLMFKDAGVDADIVSVKGGKIPLDPTSMQESTLTAHCHKFLGDASLKKLIEETPSVKDVSGEYDGVFLPGGHGVVFDVTTDEDTVALVAKFWAQGKIVAAVCHGPGGLLAVKTPTGEPIVKGKKVSGFTNAEEEAVGKTHKVPYLLEDELVKLGALYEKGDNWVVYGVTDGKLITGQNPMSSEKVAELILEALD